MSKLFGSGAGVGVGDREGEGEENSPTIFADKVSELELS